MITCDGCNKILEHGGFPSFAVNFNGKQINFGVAHEDLNSLVGLDKNDWCKTCALKEARLIIQHSPWIEGGE